MSGLYWVFRFLFKVSYGIFFRPEAFGTENVPSQGGAIIAANHLSYLDPPLVGIVIKRRATYVARSSLYKIPLVGTFVDSFSVLVDRTTPKPSSIKEVVRRLKAGELVVMFPEGSRSPQGDTTEAKRGVAAIAGMSGVPVIPAFIEGTDRALPVGAKFIRPAKVSIRFGRPLEMRAGESGGEFQKRIAGEIMGEIRKLRDVERFQSER